MMTMMNLSKISWVIFLAYQQLKLFCFVPAFYLIPTDNFDWKSQILAGSQSFPVIFSESAPPPRGPALPVVAADLSGS